MASNQLHLLQKYWILRGDETCLGGKISGEIVFLEVGGSEKPTWSRKLDYLIGLHARGTLEKEVYTERKKVWLRE